ncbi:hypothetical protein HYFRA_00011953 [Hymenoscyphus fraxineus]|uniref:Cytochrome P450 n=1 Tax=Hymenoscyphus fraxineus TaxID=746836 RepID=A0A9N9L307_9HELO|nr:hypothetical protein HYFRA_00011953 [Hymenoscyphus fraxineus]
MIDYQNPTILALVAGVAIFLVGKFVRYYLRRARAAWILSKYPIVNPEWNASDRERLLNSSQEVILEGLALANGGPFRIEDGSGIKLVLPPKYIDEIKDLPQLSSQNYNVKDFFANYPGFDAFRSSNHKTEVIWTRGLKREMAGVWPLAIPPMAKEISSILDKTYGQTDEWKEIGVYNACISVISRITQLVLLGEDFMNNEEWKRVATSYSVNVFRAAATLHQWNKWLRPIVVWYLPICRQIRAEVKQARAILQPEVVKRVEYRKNERDGAIKDGQRRRRVLDSIDWFVAANPDNKPFDYVGTQISLALAANQTSSNVLAYVLGDLISHPEYLQPLRDELTAVLRDVKAGPGYEFDKATLHRLVLMDSFMKESMRLHPPANITMRRQATEDIRLADGTEIPRDTYLFVAPVPMKDPAVFENPEVFDGYRFLRMREQQTSQNQDGGKYHLVSTSSDLVMWDYGLRVCPGRFLAGAYLKLIFAHLLLKYDFQLLPGQNAFNMGKPQGFMTRPDKEQKLMYRSRKSPI